MKALVTIVTGKGAIAPGAYFDAADHGLSDKDLEVLVAQGHASEETDPEGKKSAGPDIKNRKVVDGVVVALLSDDGKETGLDRVNKDVLTALAADLGVTVGSDDTKAQIIDAIGKVKVQA